MKLRAVTVMYLIMYKSVYVSPRPIENYIKIYLQQF